eukprot:354069-Chlamydomonas_euryale.AAC.23
MRNIGNRAKKPTHLVPMAMFSYPMMPPPPKAEKDVGERRLTAFTPVGISACEELNVKAIVGGITDKVRCRQRCCAFVDASVSLPGGGPAAGGSLRLLGAGECSRSCSSASCVQQTVSNHLLQGCVRDDFILDPPLCHLVMPIAWRVEAECSAQFILRRPHALAG